MFDYDSELEKVTVRGIDINNLKTAEDVNTEWVTEGSVVNCSTKKNYSNPKMSKPYFIIKKESKPFHFNNT